MTYFLLGISLLINMVIIYLAWIFIRVPNNQTYAKPYKKPDDVGKTDPLRGKVIEELSKRKLVYAAEEQAYVVRKQIN